MCSYSGDFGEIMVEILFPGATDSEEFRKAHIEGTLAGGIIATTSTPTKTSPFGFAADFGRLIERSGTGSLLSVSLPVWRRSLRRGNTRSELSDVYEVLRLEGLQIRHVRGKPGRYFAVRWKGNWPSDQNPT
ncbi:hypothetical protein K4K54_012412 [Colletotrichum sp. SAR 10_86]|nr:hypothetical protein KHU50_000554 [Colletotrichum sp. SAR 10_65]KAI8232072.1 hypothetical protein K4K54_012412 [Colletotrichum sp. SAR 10_86]